MGRPGYKRTSTRCQYGQSALEGALLAIKDGASMKSVAAKFGISRKTLRRHRDGLVQTPGVIKLGSIRPVLPLEIENELVIHLLDMQSRFFGLSGQDVRKLAFELVTNNNIEHRFDLQRKMAGRKWLQCFIGRHSELSIRKPEATSMARAVGFNRTQVERFFEILENELAKGFQQTNVWNIDESGITAVHVPGRIVAKRGEKQVGKVTSGERGRTVTVVCAVNAAGTYCPPMMIFPRKRMPLALMKGAPAGSIGACSDNGWMDGTVFLQWLRHFVNFSKASMQNQVASIRMLLYTLKLTYGRK